MQRSSPLFILLFLSLSGTLYLLSERSRDGALRQRVSTFCEAFQSNLRADRSRRSLSNLQYLGRPRDIEAFQLCSVLHSSAETERWRQAFSVAAQDLRAAIGQQRDEALPPSDEIRSALEVMASLLARANGAPPAPERRPRSEPEEAR